MDEFEIWNGIGNICFKIGAYDEAIAAYTKAIQHGGEADWLYGNLALAYCHKGKNAEAILLYQKSIGLLMNDNEREISRDRLGDAYWRLSEYGKAMTTYQRAIEIEAAPALLGAGSMAVSPNAGVLPTHHSTLIIQEDRFANWLKVPEVSEMVEALPNTRQEIVPSGESVNWSCKSPSSKRGGDINNLREIWQNPTAAPSALDYLNSPTQSGQEQEINQPVLDASTCIAQKSHPVVFEELTPAEQTGSTFPMSSTLPVEKPSIQAALELGQPSRFRLLLTGALPEVPTQDKDTDILKWAQDGSEQRQLNKDTLQEDAMCDPGQPKETVVIGTGTKEDTNIVVSDDFIEYGDMRRRMSNLEDGIALYKRITENTPTNDGAWDTLGNLLRTIGRYDEANSAFDQAISLHPDKEDYHYHLGLTYAAQRCHEKAIEEFQKVIQLDPEYTLAHGALAGSYRRIGQEANAAKHINIALPFMREEKEYNRACFEAICGNTDQAIEFLSIALEGKQTSLEWIRCDPDLDSIRDTPRFKALVDQGSWDAKTKASSSRLCAAETVTQMVG